MEKAEGKIKQIGVVPAEHGYLVIVDILYRDDNLTFAFNTIEEVLAFLETNLD